MIPKTGFSRRLYLQVEVNGHAILIIFKRNDIISGAFGPKANIPVSEPLSSKVTVQRPQSRMQFVQLRNDFFLKNPVNAFLIIVVQFVKGFCVSIHCIIGALRQIFIAGGAQT
jgi:hypothetical protein